MTRFLLFLCVALLFAGCQPLAPALQLSPSLPPPGCFGNAGEITWTDISDKDHRDSIDLWCHSVGTPVVDVSPAAVEGDVTRLLILSWNVHVGGGQVAEVVEMLHRERASGSLAGTGIVLLLQEVFRAGDGVPETYPHLFKAPGRIAPRRFASEVGHLASELGMSVAYIPSMRNGDAFRGIEREDRGSAILSTEPLGDITAIELPMLKQRRVVVMATVTPRGGRVPPLRVMATHLDTLGPRGTQARALARYIDGLSDEPPLIMGGDLNSLWGARDVTVSTLAGVMTMEPCGTQRTHLFGRFDYIFSTLGKSPARTCETLNEKYASDHKPLLLTLDWRGPGL